MSAPRVQPMSPARWIGALVFLLVIGLLFWRESAKLDSSAPPARELDMSPISGPEIPGLDAADLPALQSLQLLLDDEPLPSRDLDLQSW
ncbi:MAG: hypothetical protein EA348_10850, partial [Pseudomonadaceae bacterium]